MTNSRLLIFLTTFLFTTSSYAQETFTISGTIQSASTGETLIGVSVIAGTAGTASNEYGFFSITLPEGAYRLEISALGMQSKSVEVELDKDIQLNIQLEEASQSLEGVTVTAPSEGRSLESPQMGVEQLSAEEIKNIPVLLGERDIIKSMQLLPGIKSAGEGSSGFFVRGGARDQNLILLDEAPVYNASHLLGFFSTFNSDAIKNMTLYKGGMPAQYGGRLSSVLDLKMNEGNNREYDVSGGIGLISAKLNVEGPVQKGRSSFLVTGRRTYADLFLKLSNDSTINNNTLYFYDLNAKINYTLGDKDRIYLSGYFGQDRLGVGETFGLDWGNGTGTVRWNHIFNNKLFSNTSLIFSNYNYKISIRSGAADFDIFSQIRDWNLKQEFQWFLNNRNNIRFGFNAIRHTIRPGEVTSANSSINPEILQKRRSLENSLYASNTWEASDRLHITYGLRATAFSILGEGEFYRIDTEGKVTDTMSYKKGDVVKTWFNLEPRLAASYRLNDNSSLKASYARNVQNLHLISNSSASSPTDKWLASTNLIKPEIADQVSLGYYRDLFSGKYELTVETYYKDLQNQIDYRDGADVFWQGDAIETQLLFGKGRAYGLEWHFKKKTGKFTGWLSYTLSKTERQIDGINNNNWYRARQDRTHDIAIVAMYQLNPRWTLSANFIYYTGDAVTLPAGKYRLDGDIIYYYTERNAYRMPDYHRLDIGATWKLKQREKFSSELTFSLYNAYGRENAYTISFREGENDPNITEAVQTAIFKFIPSISYNFKF
ncbi:outer membrane receptor protein involved in Fe transport [Anseongella ginsenosidimutans]|uniref:Outer membrane receptor protein involved in Fe transport n=1 Tax=Anseongella ginsenosidimutans TaxID=496056 RepID=A0A4R3KP03_9SPHI|nr:TonB-dependent receptor [Anseongella ginsenosidimutans]QEC52434.1 TonB-dependent receptor [Anseongella ginsenosidimutans]TCS85816.1 outer membrane receptor protein involved in Fe transport [Anseongella ginsenosidimutans]